MNKTFAVLSYPNSNNLGDFIQSEAVKQYLKNQIIQELIEINYILIKDQRYLFL